ncbi:MAG TPA: hypothetical protein VHH73_06195 [Verrucomicrobiae bacterium]|nr:hypothetical protein [Verrucomicrobiae bacterium]
MPQLDENKAKDYFGKTVLLGVTYLDHMEVQTGQMQWFGTITEVSNARGIVIALQNEANPCALPPDLSSLRAVKPGQYRLRATSAVITNPNFIATWVSQAPAPKTTLNKDVTAGISKFPHRRDDLFGLLQ